MRMWSLQKLLLTAYVALRCVSGAAGLIRASGYERREVNISCSYGEGYQSYEKYLCKGGCGSDDVLITTTGQKKNKYFIHDDTSERVFTTTIYDLRREDVGTYWCGVTRNGKDLYTEVWLEVGRDTCCEKFTPVQSHEDGSVSFSCPYEPENQSSMKYICRGNQTYSCQQQAIVTSDRPENGRFRLTDDTGMRQFTVMISSLTLKDSGFYLCGVQRSGLDVFTAVALDVKKWCCVKSKRLNGTVGHPVTMMCPYSPQHRENRKFLCKGEHRSSCLDIGSRFALQDNVFSSYFLGTLPELRAEDTGTYWCGSDSQWKPGNYTKIQLSVVLPQQTSTVTASIELNPSTNHPGTVLPQQTSTVTASIELNPSTNHPGTEAASFHLVVFIVPAVLLIATITLVVLCKRRCHKTRETEATFSRNKLEAAEAEEVASASDIYVNQDMSRPSKQRTFKPQTSDFCDAAGEAQEDAIYRNIGTADDIYCNC